jgi:protein TonB
MTPPLTRHNTLRALAATSVAAIMAGCTSSTVPAPRAPTPVAPPPASGPSPVPAVPTVSGARNPRDYRRDAASQIYARNASRIYKGPLPPLLHAIGVLQVEVDGKGRVTSTHWMRAPKHAPDVMAEIERIVRLAAPFPIPVRMGHVTYTDTWLWDKSGSFQLDTLTEGQL